MCIRDSYQTEAEESGARIVHSCGFDSIPSDLGVWFTQQEAVSYTHLRAHETVLDLVCRLLLEKKQ